MASERSGKTVYGCLELTFTGATHLKTIRKQDKEDKIKMTTLKHARCNANWHQKHAAEYLKISQPLLSHYENGTRRIPEKMFLKMCNLYKVKPEQIELKNPTDKKNKDSSNRSSALRWALARIVGEDNIEEIIQLSLMIVEAEK